jgi:hypothetical protein
MYLTICLKIRFTQILHHIALLFHTKGKGKGKVIPLWAVRFSRSSGSQISRQSALRTYHLYPQEIFLVLVSVTPYSSGAIGNRIRYVLACSALPQPTTPQHSPLYCMLDPQLLAQPYPIPHKEQSVTIISILLSINPYLTENKQPDYVNYNGDL